MCEDGDEFDGIERERIPHLYLLFILEAEGLAVENEGSVLNLKELGLGRQYEKLTKVT